VYRTIDKIFEIINRFWKNKREQRNKQKESLKANKENCSWSQSAPEDKALLKWWRVIRSEFIRSWNSSEASSSEAENHQKLQFIRRCKLKASKAVQLIQCRLSITKEWKSEATTNSKGFKGIGCLFFCRALTKYNCTKCTTTTSTTQSLSLLQDKDNNSACNNVLTYMKCIWNWSFIGQQPYQAMNHWWLIKASNDSFWMNWQFTTFISHLYIKELRLEER